MSPNIKASIIITIILAVLVLIVGHKAKKQDPSKPSKGLVLVFEILIDWINGMCKENLGPKWKKYAPMIVTLALFIFISFYLNLYIYINTYLSLFCLVSILMRLNWMHCHPTHLQHLTMYCGYISVPVHRFLPFL